jgi:hypothetical protein
MARDRLLYTAGISENRAARGAMTGAWVSSSLSYGAWNLMMFDPTRSRWQGGLILQTYRGWNGPWEASDGEATWAAFNGGGDDVRWCSGTKDFSGCGGVGSGSSSKHQIRMWDSGVVARWWWRGSAMAAKVWAKFARDRALFVRVLAPNHKRQKS